jgi:glycosyltransferase involved in cell wall biosynthesis
MVARRVEIRATARRPLFSVLIPSYNSSRFLRATLESLSQQQEQDFEVIVVDDRSTDDSAQLASLLITEFGLNGSVRVRSADEQRGVSTCRNIGLREARGDWVAFLDSDDLFEPSKLAAVSEAIKRFGNVAGAIYHKSARFDDESGMLVGESSGGGTTGEPRWLFDQLLTGNFHATCGMVVRRDLIEQSGGFDPRLNGVEDWWLVLKLSKRTPWVYLDRSLARIRVRSQSLMTSQSFDRRTEQHVALLQVARCSGELDSVAFRKLQSYVMGSLSRHFAGVSARRGQWMDLARGLYLIARAGYVNEALDLAYRELRSAFLRTAVRVVRGR